MQVRIEALELAHSRIVPHRGLQRLALLGRELSGLLPRHRVKERGETAAVQPVDVGLLRIEAAAQIALLLLERPALLLQAAPPRLKLVLLRHLLLKKPELSVKFLHRVHCRPPFPPRRAGAYFRFFPPDQPPESARMISSVCMLREPLQSTASPGRTCAFR